MPPGAGGVERIVVSMAADDAPRAHGDAVLAAVTRTTPEDFRVAEIDGFDASGAGEHLLLTVEKRDLTTPQAARAIAAWAGTGEDAVGYAGLKDRHAVTVQRFTVQLPGRADPDTAALAPQPHEAERGATLRVLAAARHARKLPRGALAGNRFALVLREVAGDPAAIDARLRAIATRGVPNRFGEQRFGREGDNVAKALAMFAGRRVRREERAMLLSAARSELFNRVLDARIAHGSWDTALDGEVWIMDGSRSVFGPEPFDDALAARLAAFDIHPSAPLWGEGELRSEGDARARELAALEGDTAQRLRTGLERARLRQERRATRMRVAGLQWTHDSNAATLFLEFSLPPGSYATTVLSELGDCRDLQGGGAGAARDQG